MAVVHPLDVRNLMNSSMHPDPKHTSTTMFDSPMSVSILPKTDSISTLSPTPESILCAARDALQSKSVSVVPMEGYLFKTYRLQHSGGFFYVLRSRPPAHIRLTRFEEERLQAEADVLRALQAKAAVVAPRLIKFTRMAVLLGSSYLVSGPFKGVMLSDIQNSLSAEKWASVDWSLGQHIMNLARTVGPGGFGPVCSDTIMPGMSTWSRYFYMVIETVLRDCQDASINLPYDIIRGEVLRHRQSLDQITCPRLTLLETIAEKNIVVDTERFQVSGVLDFSTAIWGDPFLSDCFYRPTIAFAHGYGRLPNGDARERTRQYLYIAYHALVAIVRHALRPFENRDDIDARRTLTAALNQLMLMPS